MIKNLTLILFLILFYSCNEKNNISSLQIIKYNSEFKDYLSDGTTESSTTSLTIAFYNNFILYGVPSTSYFLKKSSIKGDTISNELVLTNDTTYTYFVFKKNAKEGLRYDSLNALNGTNFKLDSLLVLINVDSANLKFFSVDLGIPNKIIKTKDKTLEIFLDNTGNGTDTIYRYFDKGMKDLNFSFSKLLDSQKTSKLYKTRFVQFAQNKDYSSAERFIKRTDVIDEIKREKISNQQLLIKLFEKFKKDSKGQQVN